MSLKISPELQLPDEAVTETFAILAKRGAGKSNAAVVIAEQMFDAGLPWVAIDPKGDWWGIRSSGDGKGAGLPVLVLGGQHADVPLEPTAGRLVADLVVDQRLTAVLDVSVMSKADMRRFLADFAERLYQRNTEPLHLFAEEAHEYIPQRVTGPDARMVGAWEKLVKWGRTHGLGVTLITQRSASLNKDVLTQVETLIALRTTGPQDQAAVRSWVDEHDTGAAMMAELRRLPNGSAFVLSPQWLELDAPLRITFARRRTFDSGATPKAGEKRTAPRTLADVDLAAIKEAMAETIEKAAADDPKALRARIRDLERQVAETPEPMVERVEVPVLTDEHLEVITSTIARWDEATAAVDKVVDLLRIELQRIQTPTMQAASTRVEAVQRGTSAPRRPRSSLGESTTPGAADRGKTRQERSETRPAAPVGTLTGPQQRVVDALAWLDLVGFTEPTKIQVGFIAGYRVGKKVGGTFGNVLGQLRADGLIEYPTAGTARLTDAGIAVATPPDIERTTDGLQRAVYARLDGPEQRVLAAVIAAYPEDITKQDVGAAAGYAVGAKVGGTFGNILGRLRSLGLIDYPAPGSVVATDLLFLD